MDYEAIDRAASRYVVVCIPQDGKPLFLTGDGFATDVPDRIKHFRDATAAWNAKLQAESDPAWQRFGWRFDITPSIGLETLPCPHYGIDWRPARSC